MAITSSGQIKISDIQTEFGGSAPTQLSEYYAGGSNVAAGTESGGGVAIPSSGEIQLSDFYGSSSFSPYTITFLNVAGGASGGRSQSGQGAGGGGAGGRGGAGGSGAVERVPAGGRDGAPRRGERARRVDAPDERFRVDHVALVVQRARRHRQPRLRRVPRHVGPEAAVVGDEPGAVPLPRSI